MFVCEWEGVTLLFEQDCNLLVPLGWTFVEEAMLWCTMQVAGSFPRGVGVTNAACVAGCTHACAHPEQPAP